MMEWLDDAAKAVMGNGNLSSLRSAPPAPSAKRADIGPAGEPGAPGMSPVGYDGASLRRPAAGFQRSPAHINVLLSGDGATLRDRSRDQTRNNSYSKAAKRSWTANLVGTGIATKFRQSDAELRAVLTETWKQWCAEADFDGVTDYHGLQALVARADFVSGEAFARRRDMVRSDGLPVPLQVQLIDAAQLPLWKTGIAPNGNLIRMGIEFDSRGKRAAYWFLRRHPGDWTIRLGAAESDLFMRVPAAEVIHVFEAEEIGQIRGEPRMAPTLFDMWSAGEYDRAELTRKKTSALFAGFIREEDAEDLTISRATPNDNADLELEPGTLQTYKGAAIDFTTPPDVGTGYEPWQYRNLTRAAAGAGVPYAAMTGDLKGANYSSMRAGALEFRRQLEQFQRHTLVPLFCRGVARWWLDAGVLGGMLPIKPADWRTGWRGVLSQLHFVPARWDWVDPLKDIKGEEVATAAGFKARSQVIEELGDDAEEVDALRAADQERAKRLGLPAAPQPGDNTIGPPEKQDADPAQDGASGTGGGGNL